MTKFVIKCGWETVGPINPRSGEGGGFRPLRFLLDISENKYLRDLNSSVPSNTSFAHRLRQETHDCVDHLLFKSKFSDFSN